jgi:SHS2 domain-containing protein
MIPEERGHRLLDHTGDMAILARAPTLAEVFDEAARALFDVILDIRTVEEREAIPVRVEGAADREDLLVRALSELLFLHDARNWVFAAFRVRAMGPTWVEGDALGEPFDAARHEVLRQVKAVTYHRVLLSEEPRGWTARVVLDL